MAISDYPVFTPREWGTNKRLSFRESEVETLTGDINQRRRGIKATVRIRGVTYKVLGGACDMPWCMCDSILKRM
jgi:hypothetical protein